MENKALYHKMITSFWFILSIIPLLALFVYWLMYLLTYKETGTEVNFTNLFSDSTIYNNVYLGLKNMVPDMLSSPFTNLFSNVFNITSTSSIEILTITCSWFVFIHIVHLIVDILLFFVNIARSLLYRLGNYKF